MEKSKSSISNSNLKLKANIKIVKPVDENLKLPQSTRAATSQPRQLGTSRSSNSPASSIRIETLKKREQSTINRYLEAQGDQSLTPRRNERATSVAAVRHGYLLTYRPPIVRATKPKNLNGPFYVFDLPQIRTVLNKQYRNNPNRKQQDQEMTEEFFYDLKLDNYFLNENNWNNQSKFLKSSSLFSAFNVYLPHLKKTKVSMITQKYIDSCLEKRNQEERLQTHRSQVFVENPN